MSFLAGGAECGPTNALSQVLKHSEGDRSLQQDRNAGPSSSRLRQLPSNGPGVAEHDLAMARQFFDGSGGSQKSFQPHGHHMNHQMPTPPQMQMQMQMQAAVSNQWSMDQHQQQQQQARSMSNTSSWASEFDGGSSQQQHPGNQQQGYSSPALGMMYGANRMGTMMYQGSMLNGAQQQQFTSMDKGKGKSTMDDVAFAKAFDELESTTGIEEVDDALGNLSVGEEKGPDFKDVWDSLQESDIPPPQEDIAKWEAEFNQLMSTGRDELDYDYGTTMKNAWEGGLGAGLEDYGPQLKFDDQGLPILDAYVFEKDNRYMDPSSSTRSPLADAKALLQQNGSLSEAALLLEAAIQKGELGEGGYEAWILLGDTRNMDEREEAGMRALVEGVKRSQEAGAMGEGMLSLAISYTNESYDKASHTMLLRWIRARFPSHFVSEETVKSVGQNSSWDSHARVTGVFLDLARAQHSQGMVDPDLQIGLGVLFYTNGDYDKARDCFQTALDARPQDYLLWNRLGSCLSNGNKPEEALGAYREALNIRPTYTRAIYNVGVACLNIGAAKESAEHFLGALALQEPTAGDSSDQLWNTLRRAFIAMERMDLADQSKPELRTNLNVFRQAGFDF